ncbi:MAG: SCP2 domain-containing protein [Gammaproteobacteria bacterium]
MIVKVFLPTAAALLNRGIHSRREAAELCESLVGKSLVVRIAGLPFGPLAVRIAASYQGVMLTAADDGSAGPADATISGTAIELQRLMFADSEASIRDGRVSVDGDIDIAEKFRELLLTARPDLEERLAAWVGESAAFQVTNLARDFGDWALDTAEEVAWRAREYLQDDARHLPTPEEANEFCAAVDDLANDVERLEARIERLAGGRAAQR